jgi:hypothetical protein
LPVTALALAVVLLAEPSEPEAPPEHVLSLNASALAVLSVRGFGNFPAALRTEFGFEIFRFLRLLVIGSLDGLNEGSRRSENLDRDRRLRRSQRLRHD